MPCGPRLDAPGVLQHVMARGIERRLLFRDDHDRQDFLHRIERLVASGAFTLYAWALLPNHFHLLVRTAHRPLAPVLWQLAGECLFSYNCVVLSVGLPLQHAAKQEKVHSFVKGE